MKTLVPLTVPCGDAYLTPPFPTASPLPRTPHPPLPSLSQMYDDHHEDSVYGLAWSLVDPWAFASLSHDGRVFVNHVPRSEKYKILI